MNECRSHSRPAPEADRSVEPPSPQSRHGLDWLNFFLADQGWSEENVGFVLTAGGLSGVVGQLPGGALVDAMRRKRLLIAVGTLMIAASAVLLALSRDFLAVF